jgi:formylglycine-generating enzyme required for sulfatase activity
LKIGEDLEIPDELVHLIASRWPKDLAGFCDWVVRAQAEGIDHAAMRAALVGLGWAATFVDWYLLAALEPRPALGTVVRNPKTGAEMILIPEGEFLMGATAVRERPIRKVFLDAYRIGRNPVTVGEFKAYCAERRIDFSKFTRPRWGWVDDHPMVRVNWQEARDFCIWAGGDLPTEAQWEKAARGTDGREYPWGNDWDASCCHCSMRTLGDAKSTSPVESHPSGIGPFGCLGMAGNVWEWCLDRYADGYTGQPDRNPTGPQTGSSRVMRGGSWFYRDPKNFCCARRKDLGPQFRNYDRGFRPAGLP